MTIVNPKVRGFWFRSGMLFKLKFIVDFIITADLHSYLRMAAKIGKNAQSADDENP
jgi:hypothetical protein